MGSSSTLGFAWSRSVEPLAFWMQTTGASLLVVKRRGPTRAWTPAQNRRSPHGLLYPPVVRRRTCQTDRSQVGGGPPLLSFHRLSPRSHRYQWRTLARNLAPWTRSWSRVSCAFARRSRSPWGFRLSCPNTTASWSAPSALTARRCWCSTDDLTVIQPSGHSSVATFRSVDCVTRTATYPFDLLTCWDAGAQ